MAKMGSGGGIGGGLLSGIGSILGGGISAFGASKAADAQIAAADKASAIQLLMYGRTRADLAKYRQFGQAGMNRLMGSIKDLTAPFAPTMAQLEGTPGYQFTLDQGEKATQNSYAAQGLGTSGSSIKGAQQYAEGLASTTFQQQLQNYLAQNMQKYNMLMGMTQVGEAAAAGTAQAGTIAGAQVGSNLIGAGNAIAGAWNSGANAIGQGINNAFNNYAYGSTNRMYPGA